MRGIRARIRWKMGRVHAAQGHSPSVCACLCVCLWLCTRESVLDTPRNNLTVCVLYIQPNTQNSQFQLFAMHIDFTADLTHTERGKKQKIGGVDMTKICTAQTAT